VKELPTLESGELRDIDAGYWITILFFRLEAQSFHFLYPIVLHAIILF